MNGMIVVDKPQGWTSHDVVAKLRGIYRQKRIGHTGTLDPMATGVLVVFLGRGTRAVELCENDEKEYVAGLRLGLVTNTQDTTGEVMEQREVSLARQQVEAILPRFLGPQQQIPPMYSAIKVGGQKLYELARKGETVERKPRSITIEELELLDWNGQEGSLRVVCSKGTYIRTLCHDIGQALGTGGCMSSLRRTRAGRFSLEDAVSLETIQSARDSDTHLALLRPVDDLFSAYPALTLSEGDEKRCRNGADIRKPGLKDGLYRVYNPQGAFLMLGKAEQGILKTVKSFFEVNEG